MIPDDQSNGKPDRMLNRREAAALIGKDISTLDRWRREGKGPAYTKTDTGRIIYWYSDVMAYLGRPGGGAN